MVESLKTGKRAPTNEELAEQSLKGSQKFFGLGEAQGDHFGLNLDKWRKGDKSGGEALIGIVTNSADSNPEYAAAVLRNIQEHAPGLYAAARAAAPKGSAVDKQMSYEENQHIGTSLQGATGGVNMLFNSVAKTMDPRGHVRDQAARAEIVRIATQDGHPEQQEAKRALLDIVKLSGERKRHTSGVPTGEM